MNHSAGSKASRPTDLNQDRFLGSSSNLEVAGERIHMGLKNQGAKVLVNSTVCGSQQLLP
jgi:hypothetical protein